MAINSNLTLLERLNETQQRLQSMEQILGKGLDQPFNCSNSGARKILYATQKDHVVPSAGAAPAYVQTGYENRFGDESSSIIEAYADMEVVGIIPKFSFSPKCHYYIIFRDDNHNYNILERISYEHTSEIYGYMYDNSVLDTLHVGSRVNKGQIIRRSESYDKYQNRQDGVNLICAYIATDKTMEDSVILSETASKKLATHLIKKVEIIINDNDIPLNLYGDAETEDYKSFPDIGEETNGGILCAIRRENREQSPYTQQYNLLSKLLMSDDKFTCHGRVVDIDIAPNSDEILDIFYNGQLKKYQNEMIRFATDIVATCSMIRANDPSAHFMYDLEKMEFNSERILKGDKFSKEKGGKKFTNCIIKFTVIEDYPVHVGDKVSDRYGGKGVVSYIFPDKLMGTDDLGRPLEVVINQSTCVNRENPGQLMETTVTHVNARLVDFIKTMHLSVEEAAKLIIEFLQVLIPELADAMIDYMACLDAESLEMYIDSILDMGMIYTSFRPISDNLTLDKINELYEHFPFIKQSYNTVPIRNSRGEIRYVRARRPIIVGHKYMFRLKQFSDEKFSSTSLSATNLKNLNTRSKNSKNYKSLHSNTPIAMGTMEVDDLHHVGPEYIISTLMIHSVSPYARRLCEKMLTGDPFTIDIRLDDSSTNRNVEILNTYLKVKGERLSFYKIKKEPKQFITRRRPASLIMYYDKEKREEQEKALEEIAERKGHTVPFISRWNK